MRVSDFSVYNNIGRTLPLVPSQGSSGLRGTDTSFGSVLKEAIQHVSELEEGTHGQLQKVLNQGPDLNSLMGSLQQADLSFQVMLQVRNRIVQAYEEMMRMPV
jgi:flagellar hook-basal body complex protein FliE